jgi:tRNA dimethylallyltransferase
MPDKYLIVVGGPTGVGKTKVSIDLAQHYQTDIVNADSRQVYKELNIGVGKPRPDQLHTVPHHLIGHISIHQAYSAGQYAHDAVSVLDALFSKKEIVILSGGTGLYLKAIMEGFDDFPDIPEEAVSRWTALWKNEGIESLVVALQKLDPEYLAVVDRNNPMRLIRALSVSEASGKPYTSFRSHPSTPKDFKIIPILLERPREELYARINQRVVDMMDQGWLEEARALFPFRTLKSLNTVGYKELFEVLEGKMTLAEAIPKIQQSTRNYAKRQLTWWRHQGQWHHFPADDLSAIINFVNSLK